MLTRELKILETPKEDLGEGQNIPLRSIWYHHSIFDILGNGLLGRHEKCN